MLPWYFILPAVLGGLILVGILVYFVKVCCCRNTNYTQINDVEPGHEETEIPSKPGKKIQIKSNNDDDELVTIEEIDHALASSTIQVSHVVETSAEKSLSDGDLDGEKRVSSGTLSAYGDTSVSGSMISVSSKASWNTSNAYMNLNLNIQASLIYSRDLRHVAGKVIQVNGLKFDGKNNATHVRIHAVVLPIKKYALKTNWYKIPPHGVVKIGEYFKFVFKLPPSEMKTMLRVRLYGRRAKVGSLGRPSCMGECYITLLEIISAKGGLTLWRALSRGIPEVILEGQDD